jgi:predicted Zn-dependent peptidase
MAARHRLANGLEIILIENHKLPIVNCHLVWRTGAGADAAGLAGGASLTAEMLDEGTPTRASLDISHELAAVGSRLATYASWDASGASLLTLTRHLDRALEIYADVVLNPTFPAKELERLRATRLASIAQRRDNAGELAEIAYAALLYGREHPYGHPLIGRAETVAALDENHVRRFYQTYYRPDHAALVVAGDVRADELFPKLEQTFSAWRAAPVPPDRIETPLPRERSTLYLLDRPGAAQSVIVIGHVGVPRATPDYFPLVVLNTLLGGMFTSRVNLNLREDKGYTYGARTAYSFRRHAGPFAATASVQTNVTGAAITEFLKELRDVRGARPVTAGELEFAKQAIVRGFPRGFETSGQLADRFADLALHHLPDDYFDHYVERIRAVTLPDVERAARLHLHPDRLIILAVGDRRTIEPALRSLGEFGETLTIVDAEGNHAGAAG